MNALGVNCLDPPRVSRTQAVPGNSFTSDVVIVIEDVVQESDDGLDRPRETPVQYTALSKMVNIVVKTLNDAKLEKYAGGDGLDKYEKIVIFTQGLQFTAHQVPVLRYLLTAQAATDGIVGFMDDKRVLFDLLLLFTTGGARLIVSAGLGLCDGSVAFQRLVTDAVPQTRYTSTQLTKTRRGIRLPISGTPEPSLCEM